MTEFDIALLVLRVWVGIVMIAHGANHLRSVEGTTRWFAKVGFKAPRMNALTSGAGEIAVGIGLLVGLLTSPAAGGLGAAMFVAFWSIHRRAGFFVFHRPNEGYEYVATLAVAGLVLAVGGPGSLSVDSALGIADNLDGAVGALIFAAGIAAGVLLLAVSWQQPTEENQE